MRLGAVREVMMFVEDPAAARFRGNALGDDLEGARDSLLAAGCNPHRGRLETDDGRVVCQLRDPFGTVWA